MCELRVYRDGEMVAKDIVRVSVEGGDVRLMDILHSAKVVEGAMVTRIDVGKEILELRSHPLLKKVIRFIEVLDKNRGTGTSNTELNSLWGEIKAEGESLVETLGKGG